MGLSICTVFVYVNDFCCDRNCLYTHRYKFSSEKKKVKSPSLVSHALNPVRIRRSGRTENRGVTNKVYKDYPIKIRECKFLGDLIELSFREFDVILRMDWLSRH